MRLTPQRDPDASPPAARSDALGVNESWPPEIAAAEPAQVTTTPTDTTNGHTRGAKEYRPPKRRRRWGLRLLLGLLLLLLIVAAIVQVVLWTDIPRNLVLSQLQKQLGLRVTADSLSTNWCGNTSLRNVGLALPMAEDAFLTVPKMDVDHTSIFGLLWTRAVTLNSITLDHPTLHVVQGPDGMWNVLEVAELLGRTGGKQPAQAEARSSPRPDLPEVHIAEMTVLVKNNQGVTSTIAPLNVDTDAEDALTYRYEVKVPPKANDPDSPELSVVGRLVPGGSWKHEVQAGLKNVADWAKPFVGQELPATAFAGQWRGEVQGDGTVAGKLDIHEARYGDQSAVGSVLVSKEAGGMVLRPKDLVVHTGNPTLRDVRLASGRLAQRGSAVTAEELIVKAMGGQVRVDGAFDPAATAGEVTAQWNRMTLGGPGTTHDGNVKLALKTPLPNQPEIYAELNSVGQSGANRWEARLVVDGAGTGTGWQSIDWKVSAQRLALLGKQPVVLDGLTMTLAQRGAGAADVSRTTHITQTVGRPPPTPGQSVASLNERSAAPDSGRATGVRGGAGSSDSPTLPRRGGANGGALPVALVSASSLSVPGRELQREGVSQGASPTRPIGAPTTSPIAAPPSAGARSADRDARNPAAATAPNANTAPPPARPAPARPAPAAVERQPGQSTITLTRIDMPGGRDVDASAIYNLTTDEWAAWLDVAEMPVPLPWGGRSPASLFVDLAGNNTRVKLNELYLRGAEAQTTVKGDWVFTRPTPVIVTVHADHLPPRFEERDRPPIFGYLRAESELRGTLSPLNLVVGGQVQARKLVVGQRDIGDVSVKIKESESRITAEHFTLRTDEMDLLGGHWEVNLRYPDDGVLGATLRVRDLPLHEVADAAKKTDMAKAPLGGRPQDDSEGQKDEQDPQSARAQNLALPTARPAEPDPGTNPVPIRHANAPTEPDPILGTVNGAWHFRIPRPDPEVVTVTGSLTARDVKAVGGFEATRIEVKTTLVKGLLRLDPIFLVHQDKATGAEGSASGRVEVDVENLKRVFVDFTINRWPVLTTPVFRADLTGNVRDLTVDLPGSAGEQRFTRGGTVRGPLNEEAVNQFRVRGTVEMTAGMALKGQPLGTASLLADLRGRVIDVRQIHVDTLEGDGTGQATIELDKLLESRAAVTWSGVNVANLIPYFPGYERLVGLEGLFDGELRVEPARDPRALEPLAVRLHLAPRQARYRSVPIGRISMTAYTDLKARAVIGSSPAEVGTIELAEGVLTFWGRLTQHDPLRLESAAARADARERVATTTALVEVDFRDLNLNQLVQAAHPTADPMIGRLHGHFRLNGSTRVEPRTADQREADHAEAQRLEAARRDFTRAAGAANPANVATTMPATGPAATDRDFLEVLTKRVRVDGDVQLTDSDLLNLDVIAWLYNAMRIGAQDRGRPGGRGGANFRLENGTFWLMNARYFNRGTEVRAMAQVDEVWKVPDSPLSGTATGNPRPFKDVKIPFLATLDVDQIMGIILGDLTTVRVGGTVADYAIAPISFAELGDAMKRFVQGDVSSQVRGSAAR